MFPGIDGQTHPLPTIYNFLQADCFINDHRPYREMLEQRFVAFFHRGHYGRLTIITKLRALKSGARSKTRVAFEWGLGLGYDF